MPNKVNIVLKENNDDYNKLIKKTAKKLKNKYSKTRKINEELLSKPTNPLIKMLSIVSDIFLIFFSIICCYIGISSFLLRMNKLSPSFAGYSIMNIASESMVDEDFNIGDSIVVRKVNAKTLNIGNNIAFYVYENDYNLFDLVTSTLLNKEHTNHDYSLNTSSFLGFHSNDIKIAAKQGSKMVFHKITNIFEDENGVYWFKTKGTSNESEDPWYVSERMVVGVHSPSKTATFFEGFLTILTNNIYGLIIVSTPLFFLAISFLIKTIKRVQLTKLEQDCVEEKRKITDEICIKNNIGFNMDKQTKYKVLVQAPPELKPQYVSLLWKDGSAPNSIRKYVIRKKFILKPMEEMLKLNRECEKMLKEGVFEEKIASYYLKEKKAIESKILKYKNILKKIKTKNKKTLIQHKN